MVTDAAGATTARGRVGPEMMNRDGIHGNFKYFIIVIKYHEHVEKYLPSKYQHIYQKYTNMLFQNVYQKYTKQYTKSIPTVYQKYIQIYTKNIAKLYRR